ncbi:phage terminase large subunit [Occallatibacter savannae]|uniref:phage terminase large subunit n=1 Tax=Occallatibacter savannae TaxID=1002691 RepID=UPI000D6860D1|nr:phage terminase large subunit [Occallatibacter savannae]
MSVLQSVSFYEYQSILRSDFASFVERSFYELNPQSEFIPGDYIDLMCSILEDCRLGRTKRLIVNLPPRTLKSHATSVALPAWILGHDPSAQIICASYGQDLADKHARDCRALMQSAFYRQLFPNTVLAPDRLAVNDFMTTAKGCRLATSVGGALTGRGADIIILDDIMKPDDALSEVRRNAANEWYFNTLFSRLNSKEYGRIIIVMQRLHQGDLIGEVLDREPWKHFSMPAIATVDETYPYETVFGPRVFSRKAGESIHPERDSVQVYESIRANLGEYKFESQYQQEPMPLAGGMIKRDWLTFYEPSQLPTSFTYLLQSWDTASKTSEMNDFSVGTTWGLYEEKFYVLDVYRKRVEFPELKRAVIEAYQKHQPHKVLIEDKASGTALIQELQREFVYGVESYKAEPGSDKRMRFAAQSIQFEKGNVLLPSQAPWLDEYVREITGFPGTKHDDAVDSTSQALHILTAQINDFVTWANLGRG